MVNKEYIFHNYHMNSATANLIFLLFPLNLMTSPAPGTTVPQAWLTTASYFTGGSSS